VTRDSHYSPSINDLNDICKKDQIDHNLQN